MCLRPQKPRIQKWKSNLSDGLRCTVCLHPLSMVHVVEDHIVLQRLEVVV